MRRIQPLLALCAVLSVAAFAAPNAVAASNPVVADCVANGKLTKTYTTSELQAAIASLSSEVSEYTNCYDVIEHQLLTQLGKPAAGSSSSGSSGSGGSFLPTPVLIVLIVLVIGAAGFGIVAVRRRKSQRT
jgi:hypothetical protein